LSETYRRVTAMGDSLGERHEIVLVNDGSRDDTLAQMLAFAQRDSALVIVNLSWNHVH
jgi:dolichol-phosphate mannosyltransferase